MFDKLLSRLRPFWDPSVLLLLAVSMVPLVLLDPAMALTLVQWTLYVLTLGGLTNLLAMVMLPSVRLSELYRRVIEHGNQAAAFVLAGLFLLMGLIFLGVVLWAKG